MRLSILIAVVALLFAACSSGPAGGDSCMPVEATANAPGGGNAAAAAAEGGQDATSAPFSGEAGFRSDPNTAINRGAGDNSTASQDSEVRETASGAAMNIGLLNPVAASAEAGSGGVSAAVQEAAKSVASARRAYSMAVMDQATTDARLEFLADQVISAQEMLNAASASSRSVTHNVYNMGGDNTMIGVGTAKTGKGESVNPEVVNSLAEGVARANEHRNLVDSPEPPAGPVEDPLNPNGGG